MQFPRSYTAWVVVNPIELAIGLGLPATVWGVIGLAGKDAPKPALAAVVVLVFLTISGKNLSEVARLWLPLMPALLVAAGRGFQRLDADAGAVAVTLGLLGAQTLALQTMIQVVYPV